MTARPRILILSFSNFARDSRVGRQVRVLRPDYELICAGTGAPNVEGVEFIELPPAGMHWNRRNRYALAALLTARMYDTFYGIDPAMVAARRALAGIEVDLVIANDLDTLPVALECAGSAPVIYDAHEYTPDQEPGRFSQLVVRRYREAYCRRYLPRVAAMTTVSPGLVERYAREFGVQPELLLNTTRYESELEPTPVSSPLRLVHHGAALANRHQELMVDVARELGDGFELHFMLVPTDAVYLKRLKRYAEGAGNVQFHEPVPIERVAAELNAYDVGLYVLEPDIFNHEYSLPNKLFEFIQGRLAIAIGPSPDMASVVREHRLGVIATDFRPHSMARALRRLDPAAVMEHKRNAHAAAERLSDRHTEQQLRELVARCLPRSRRA